MSKRRVHRIPHEEVKDILFAHGIRSVNQAVEWGDTAGSIIFPPGHTRAGERRYPLISSKSVEGIVRGRRVLGVEFDRVDQILCALDSPEHWYKELSRWYYPPHVAPDPDCETFLSQTAAFERACELLEGVDSGLSFG